MQIPLVTRVLIYIVGLVSIFMFLFNLIALNSDSSAESQYTIEHFSKIEEKAFSFFRERTMMNSENVKCVPATYGISELQDPEIFTVYKEYPNCAKLNPGAFSIENETLIFTCKGSGLFMFSNSTSEELFGRYDMKFKWETKGKFEKSKNSEWVFAKCLKNKLALLRNIFNNTSAIRAKKITEQKKAQYGKTDNFRPLTVLLIVLDSVSRQSFFRNLPKTVQFINESLINTNSDLGQKFLMYDFLVNNAHGEKTPQNMAPILYGRTLEEFEDLLLEHSIFDEKDWPVFEKLQEESMWKHYERNGFVTSFVYDSYTDYVSHFTGRRIFTDHVVCNFWRAANIVVDYVDYTDEGQCIGNKWAYEYAFDYVNGFINNYKGINKFAYMHLDVAHETTGRRLNIADENITKFIKGILKYYQENTNEDLFFMLGADHGRMATVMSKEAWNEKMLPYQLVFANRELIQRTKSHYNLLKNSDRLVTRFDWHKTLKHMALIPYTQEYHEDEVVKDFKSYRGISLIEKQVPDDRDCRSEEIGSIYCSCIYTKNYIDQPLEDYYLKKMISKGIKGINNFITKNGADQFCHNFTLGSVISSYEVFTTVKDPMSKKNYYVTLSDLIFPHFQLDIEIRYGLKNDFFYVPNKYGLRPYNEKKIATQRGKSKVIVTQISSITNSNSSHYCKELPKKFAKFHDICNCKDKSKIVYSLYFSESYGQNCKGICANFKSKCVDYEHITQNKNTVLNALKQQDIIIDQVVEGDILGIKGSNLLIPTSPYCDKVSNSTSLLCVCYSYS